MVNRPHLLPEAPDSGTIVTRKKSACRPKLDCLLGLGVMPSNESDTCNRWHKVLCWRLFSRVNTSHTATEFHFLSLRSLSRQVRVSSHTIPSQLGTAHHWLQDMLYIETMIGVVLCPTVAEEGREQGIPGTGYDKSGCQPGSRPADAKLAGIGLWIHPHAKRHIMKCR